MQHRSARVSMTVTALIVGCVLGRATTGEGEKPDEVVEGQRLVYRVLNLGYGAGWDSSVELFIPEARLGCNGMLKTDRAPTVVSDFRVESRDEPSWKEDEEFAGPNTRVENVKLPKKLVRDLRALADLSANVNRESERLQAALRDAGLLAVPAGR